MDVLGRYRNLIVLVTVLFAQVLGLAVQVKRTTDSEPTRLIRVWAVGAVTPFEEALHWLQTSTGGIWHNYLYLRGVRAENRGLKQEIQQMRLEQARMSQDADQAHRLQALLGFKEQFISQTMAAQVIGWSGSEQSRSIYIDKGVREGIKPDMAVITKDGIVGKVLQVFGSNPLERSVAQVLLIDDQTSGVGAILDKTRLQGILRGTPSGDVMLEKVMSDEAVQVGEVVLTSGGDGIFPKGLPVGKVTRVSTGGDLFLNIRVRPAANLSRLEEVLVVTKIDELQAQPEQTGPMRAVDILAERLPTVPAKPETAADATGKTAAAPAGGAAATTPGSGAPNGGGANPGPTNKGATSPGGPQTGIPQAAVPSAGATNANTAAVKKNAPASVPSGGALGTGSTTTAAPGTRPATSPTKAATKPVNSTVTPKPQPAAEDTPQ
ncbi:MAG: rod shape-determining protein MreC [Terriglobales bacterium]